MKTGAEWMDGAQSGFQSHRGCGELESVKGGGKGKEKARLASLWDSRAGSTGLHAVLKTLAHTAHRAKNNGAGRL